MPVLESTDIGPSVYFNTNEVKIRFLQNNEVTWKTYLLGKHQLNTDTSKIQFKTEECMTRNISKVPKKSTCAITYRYFTVETVGYTQLHERICI